MMPRSGAAQRARRRDHLISAFIGGGGGRPTVPLATPTSGEGSKGSAA